MSRNQPPQLTAIKFFRAFGHIHTPFVLITDDDHDNKHIEQRDEDINGSASDIHHVIWDGLTISLTVW